MATPPRIQLLALANQLAKTVAGIGDTTPLTDRMTNTFPWILALSPEDRATCTRDIINTTQAALATSQPHLALTELTSWKETATAITAGLGRDELEWINTE